MSLAARRRLTALLWLAFAAGAGVVVLGALGERSGEAPPPGASAPRDSGPPRPARPPKRWDFTTDFVRDAAAARNPSADRYGGAGVWRYMAAARQRSRDPATFALLRRFGRGCRG